MQVDDAARVVIQERCRNDLTEIRKQRRLRTDGFDHLNLRCVTNLGDVYDPQSSAACPSVDRGRQRHATSTGGTWWRRHHSGDFKTGVRCNGAERRDGESATAK